MVKNKKKLKFYSKSHKYKLGKSELISVTKFIHSYFEPFDAKAIARKLAKFPTNKKAKRGVRYWLGKWKEDSEHGTTVHDGIDAYIKGTPITEIETKCERDALKLAEGIAFVDELEGDLYSEEVQYDEELGLAGTIDLKVINKDGTVSLYDWKTNKAIKSKPFNKGQVGKPPLNDLGDCNLNHYSLQLSIYAYMLERQGYKIKDLTLVHLQEDKTRTYNIDYTEFKPYVEKLMEDKNARRSNSEA